MSTLSPLLSLALGSSIFLSGAMASFSLVTIPTILSSAPSSASTSSITLLRHWARAYHYGHLLMPAGALGTAMLYLLNSRERYSLVAAGCAVGIVPWTFVVMVPTNRRLFDLLQREEERQVAEEKARGASGADETDVRRLIVRWSWMHAVRSLWPLAGAVTVWVKELS